MGWLPDPAPADVPGRILAEVSYNPGTQMSASTSSGTFVDVDATNLAVTFTAPASGIVNVILSGTGGGNTSTALIWGLREGSSDISGSDCWILNTNIIVGAVRVIRLSGLSAGSHTYKWAHRSNSAGTTVSTYAGGTSVGPAVMRVEVGI